MNELNCSYQRAMDILRLSEDERKDIDCLLYTSDAADDMQCVDLGGRRIIKKEYVNCFFKKYCFIHNSFNSYEINGKKRNRATATF